MQAKSSRGVQQEDVWGAADALIAEGLRPTIERVRQKMGRGSPNTVSPLLEAWFATLGSRLSLGGTNADDGGPPAAVRQAMEKLWEVALSTAHQDAKKAHEQAQQALNTERAALAERESKVERKAEVLTERLLSADAALADARRQIELLNSRLLEANALLSQRAAEIEGAQAKLAAAGRQLAEDRNLRDQDSLRHGEERQRLEARSVANERRLMEELDRERQESKRAKSAVDQAERKVETLRAQMETDIKTVTGRVRETETELAAVRQALKISDERANELRGFLDEQRELAKTALDQLNRLLSDAKPRPAIGGTPKRKRAGATAQ